MSFFLFHTTFHIFNNLNELKFIKFSSILNLIVHKKVKKIKLNHKLFFQLLSKIIIH